MIRQRLQAQLDLALGTIGLNAALIVSWFTTGLLISSYFQGHSRFLGPILGTLCGFALSLVLFAGLLLLNQLRRERWQQRISA